MYEQDGKVACLKWDPTSIYNVLLSKIITELTVL